MHATRETGAITTLEDDDSSVYKEYTLEYESFMSGRSASHRLPASVTTKLLSTSPPNRRTASEWS